MITNIYFTQPYPACYHFYFTFKTNILSIIRHFSLPSIFSQHIFIVLTRIVKQFFQQHGSLIISLFACYIYII